MQEFPIIFNEILDEYPEMVKKHAITQVIQLFAMRNSWTIVQTKYEEIQSHMIDLKELRYFTSESCRVFEEIGLMTSRVRLNRTCHQEARQRMCRSLLQLSVLVLECRVEWGMSLIRSQLSPITHGQTVTYANIHSICRENLVRVRLRICTDL